MACSHVQQVVHAWAQHPMALLPAHPAGREIRRGAVLSLSLHPSCAHFLATFVGKLRSPSRRDRSLDLGKERQMRSNVTERSSFCAHPMSRPHACAARNQAHLGWTDYVSRVLRCAAPCARRASTAQKARSRRDLQSLPRNLVLKASFACTRCRAGARAGRETTPTWAGRIM